VVVPSASRGNSATRTSPVPSSLAFGLWREKREREEVQQHESSLRRILRQQGLPEEEIETKVDEQIARLESFRQRSYPKASEDENE
jgi:hypothetical protein